MDGMTAVYNEDRGSVAAQLCDEIDNCNKRSGMTVEESSMQHWMNGRMCGPSPWRDDDDGI